MKLPYVTRTVNVLCQCWVPMELGPCGNVCCKHCQILYYYGNYCQYCPEIRDLLMKWGTSGSLVYPGAIDVGDGWYAPAQWTWMTRKMSGRGSGGALQWE